MRSAPAAGGAGSHPASGPRDLPPSEQDPAGARDAADDILARSEYQEGDESLLERLDRELGELFESLLDGVGLSVGGGTASWLGWVVLVILVGGVVAYLGWALATGRLGRGARRPDRVEPVVTAADAGRTASDWAGAARAHEAEGRWREGILCRYRALVVELCARGVIADVAGRTAGEYLADVAAGPYRAEPFTEATDMFERVWYGGEDGGPRLRDRFGELADGTLAAVGADRRGSAGHGAPAGAREAAG